VRAPRNPAPTTRGFALAFVAFYSVERVRFADEVGEAVRLVYGAVTPDDVKPAARAEVAYAKDPARLAEATVIEPIVDAFARAELRPRTNKGLGVYGPNLVKALGHQLGDRRLAKMTPEQDEGALHAIRGALASGYMAFMSLEPDNPFSLSPNADLRRIWAVSVVNFRADGVRVLRLPDAVIASLEHLGEDALVTELQRAGVIGRRKARIGQLGKYYAHAGALMRAAQTDVDLPIQTELFAATLERWPFDEYVEAG
jgi:hypothetical protein